MDSVRIVRSLLSFDNLIHELMYHYRTRPLIVIAVAVAVGSMIGRSEAAMIIPTVLVIATVATLISVRSKSHFCYALGAFFVISLGRSWFAWHPGVTDLSKIADGRSIQCTGRVQNEIGDDKFRTLIVEVIEVSGEGNRGKTGNFAVPLFEKAKDIEVGDTISITGRLTVPPPARNDGGFDDAEFLSTHGAWCEVVLFRSSRIKLLDHPTTTTSPVRFFHSIRKSAIQSIDRSLSPLSAGIVQGLLLGATTKIPVVILDDFGCTGTIHILATAGLHVGILTAVLLGLLTQFRVPLYPRIFLTAIMLLAFIEVAGGRPAVTRAGIMSAVALFSLLFRRKADRPTLLAFAALIIMWLNPTAIFGPGFQMSFATVAVLIAFAKPFHFWFIRLKETRLHIQTQQASTTLRMLNGFAGLVYMSIFAFVGSCPIIAQHFHEFSWIGIIANIFIVPVVGLIFVGGLIIVLTAPAFPLFAALFGEACIHPIIHFLIGTVSQLARLPYACVAVTSPGWFLVAGYYFALFWIASTFSKKMSHHKRLRT